MDLKSSHYEGHSKIFSGLPLKPSFGGLRGMFGIVLLEGPMMPKLYLVSEGFLTLD